MGFAAEARTPFATSCTKEYSFHLRGHSRRKGLNQTYQVYQGSSAFASLHLVKMLIFIQCAWKGRGLYDLHSTTAREYQNFLYGIHILERTFKKDVNCLFLFAEKYRPDPFPIHTMLAKSLCEMKSLTMLQDSQDCSAPCEKSRSTIRAAPLIQYLSQMKVFNSGPTRCSS